MSKGDRLDRLFQILRLSGAAMILAAAGTFLVQSWGDAGDVVRYLGLLGATALVPIVAYVCGVRLHEGRSARTLVLTFLALLPIHAALLGAFVLSRADGSKPALTSIAQWVAPSTAIATALIILSATVLLPFAWASFRVLARPHARKLTVASTAAHALLLVPSREPEACALLVLTALGIAAWSAKRVAPDTREAVLAVGSLLLPAVVLGSRQALFYSVTGELLGVTMGGLSAAMIVHGRRRSSPRVERAAIAPTLVAVFALWTEAVSKMPFEYGVRWLCYGWAAGLVLALIAWTSTRSVRFFGISALGLNALIAMTVVSFTESALPALQLLVVGLLLLSDGLVRERRFAVYAGATTAALGFVHEIRFAIARFEPMGWLALGGLGIGLVGLTAWLERRARATRPAGCDAKVSERPEPSLPGWHPR